MFATLGPQLHTSSEKLFATCVRRTSVQKEQYPQERVRWLTNIRGMLQRWLTRASKALLIEILLGTAKVWNAHAFV
jgi:hypothetical protein